jgi:hypothetical protein
VFDDLRRNIVDHFVDIGGIVDEHCLTCLSISFNWRDKEKASNAKIAKNEKNTFTVFTINMQYTCTYMDAGLCIMISSINGLLDGRRLYTNTINICHATDDVPLP